VKLTADKGGLKVYRNHDRTNPIQLGQAFAAPQQDLIRYVEAISPGDKTLTLWVNGKPTKQTVKITSFRWLGPLSVPQYGTYKYTVATPPKGGKWLDRDNGVVEAGAGTSAMDIFWIAGPVVGKAVYQAHADYVWDLEVNIVEVVVDAPDPGPAFTPGQVTDAGFDTDNADRRMKLVKAVGPGLKWQAKVTFNGPNGDRGVRQMRAGFVQNLKVTTLTGTYADNTTLTSKMQGVTYWDTKDNHQGAFYSSPSANPVAFFQNATAANKTKVISEDDEPGWGPPTLSNGSQLNSMQLQWDFRLYVVGLTWDRRNTADQTYVSQAEADWTFNGSGSVVPANNFAWTAAGAGVTPPPTGWGGVMHQMITTAPRFNDTFRNTGWI
jgi:hypothetical protein